jgi:predicted LPLAT superfamily acyltransferase
VEAVLSRLEPSAAKKLINVSDVDGETALHVALSREGDPPVPLAAATAPATSELVPIL